MTRAVHRVTQCYDAEDDDELSLKTGQMITILAIEDNGWAEGILENRWVGWFPIECVVEDNSEPPTDASLESLQQMRLDNLFKNADNLDGAVNKTESMALTVLEKLNERNAAILDFMECESHFVKSMNIWMSAIESDSVFSLLSKDQADTLLEAIDDVVNFHHVLLGSLEVVGIADPADQMFGGYFLDFIPFFSEVYLKLKSLLPKIVTLIVDSNKSQSVDIMSVLHFSADIHMPVQHVTKMVNFTRSILNVTPLDHEDWTFTMYSWRSLRDAVKKINQEVKVIESKETLNTFLEKLDFYDGPPIQSYGQLVRYGTLRIGDRRQIFHIYLLERKLFILKSSRFSLSAGRKSKRNSFSSGTKFTIEHEVMLDSFHVKAINTNTDMDDDLFRISYFLEDGSIKFIDCYAFNKEIKNVWVGLLNDLVKKQDDEINAEKMRQSKENADNLYQNLMSFIEIDEPSDFIAPPLPPKDDIIEYYREDSEHPTNLVSEEASLPPPPKNESEDFSDSVNQDAACSDDIELDTSLDTHFSLDEKDLRELNIQNSVSDDELDPDELIRENPLNIEPLSFTDHQSLEGSEKQTQEETLKNPDVDTKSDQFASSEFVTDEEYATLLTAYNEKVAQVEELKRQLMILSQQQ